MTIQEIKAQLTMARVLSHYNLSPNKQNMLCCPFHPDKTPSMQIYPATNTAFCFSSNCQLQGKSIDTIDFILYKEQCSKHEALLKAKVLLGQHIIQTVTTKTTTDYTTLFQDFKTALIRSKKAIDYLKTRYIYDIKLTIGYNNGTTYNQLKNCLIFPLKDSNNEIVSLYGRSITDHPEQRHFYLNNRKGLYPSYPTVETTTLILTESIIDATTLLQYTDYQILALYGTNGLTQEHLAALQNLTHLNELILFFDGDAAGWEATQKYSTQLHQQFPGITISQVHTPENEDINSLVQGHAPDILDHLIAARTTIFSFSTENSIEKVECLDTSLLKCTSTPLNTSQPEYITWQKGNILISILGGITLYPIDKLKITIKLERNDSPNPLHTLRTTLDLYQDEQVERLIRKGSERLEISTKILQLILVELTQLLEDHRVAQLKAAQPIQPEKRKLTPAQREQAINFLQSPDLLQRTNDLIGQTGMVGEETNRLLMYLIFTSRLREYPLHVISLGSSGTGKTYLQEKIAQLIPEADKLEITTLSENALYYFDRQELKNKLVLIEDLDGAKDDKILYAIRELMTKKKISKTIPIKDSKGNLKTITLQVEGPISLAGTTTREKLYEDNANRSILIYLDNSQAHKEQIMDYQRSLSAGKINATQEEEIKLFFKNIQSMLEPITVKNPYATQLVIPDTVFKPLRTNAHYLNFIEVITFYKQYQRETKVDPATGAAYIETTLADIQEANTLLKEVLLAKSDELTKTCRDFLENLKLQVIKENIPTFFRAQVRVWFRINPHNLRYYLSQLVQYGYLQIVGGNKHKQGYEYEITNREEYIKLNTSISNALDHAFSQLV